MVWVGEGRFHILLFANHIIINYSEIWEDLRRIEKKKKKKKKYSWKLISLPRDQEVKVRRKSEQTKGK